MNKRHGAAKGWPAKAAPEYRVWLHIRQRCRNPTDAAYSYYGERGITFSEAWEEYPAFLADVGPRPSDKHTIERIDNDKGYEPGNVTWVTRKQQARNRRSSLIYTWKGEDMCLAELCEREGVPYQLTWERIKKRGRSLEEAVAMGRPR